jgi:hypothetical protein
LAASLLHWSKGQASKRSPLLAATAETQGEVDLCILQCAMSVRGKASVQPSNNARAQSSIVLHSILDRYFLHNARDRSACRLLLSAPLPLRRANDTGSPLPPPVTHSADTTRGYVGNDGFIWSLLWDMRIVGDSKSRPTTSVSCGQASTSRHVEWESLAMWNTTRDPNFTENGVSV